MNDPKAIRKAIMTARNIAAMVDPHFARVPLPQIGEPDPEEMMPPEQFSMGGRLPAQRSDNPFEQFQPQDPFSFDLPDHQYAAGGEVYGDNSKIKVVGNYKGEHRLVPISPKNTNYRHVMEYVPIDWLMERRGNEYRHSPERMEQLRNEIQEEGLREPVLISTGKNSRTSIVGEGNHRVLAAKQLGYTHIPVRAMVGSSAGSDVFPEGAHDEDIIPKPNEYFPSDAKPSRVMRSLGYEGQPELPEDWWEKGYATGGGTSNNNHEIIAYHGTNKDFDEFGMKQPRGGITFTTDKSAADDYAQDRARKLGGKPRTVKVRLKVNNPFNSQETNYYVDDVHHAKTHGHDAVIGPAIDVDPDIFPPHLVPKNITVWDNKNVEVLDHGHEPAHMADGGTPPDFKVDNAMSVFPKPQRMWDDQRPGGAYLSMPDKEDVTGHRAAQASIGIGEGGKPYFHASRDAADETGSPGKGSALVKTNLFKQRAGWRWLDAPEGHEGTSTIVSVEHRGKHHYVMDAHFPKGVDLSRYPDAPSEPRLRPTTRGNVELGPQVGSILVRGREHPVHSHAIVREYGGRVGYADGGMLDDEQPTDYAAPDNMGLYSHGAATAAASPQAKASPQEFRSMLTNRGVKPAEFQESGYDEAFADQPQVTREQVAEHFHQNRTPIEEKRFYDNNPQLDALEKDYWDKLREIQARKVAHHEANPDQDNTGWGNDEKAALRDDYHKARAAVLESKDYIPSAGNTHHEEHILPGGENYREIVLKHGGDDIMFPGEPIHLGGEPNVLVHLLMKDRTDTEGKRLLHLDELQSDWGQKGRKEGFSGPIDEDRFQQLNSMPDSVRTADEDAELTDMFKKLQGVSTGPYVTKTDDWVDLGLKRAMMEAAKGGHDKLAWTPGDVVADRYNLSKHIKDIHHEKNDDGTYNVMAYNHKGAKVYDQDDLAEKDVVDALGKEVAGKIFSGEGIDREGAQAKIKEAHDAYERFKEKIVETDMQRRMADRLKREPNFDWTEEKKQELKNILSDDLGATIGGSNHFYAKKMGLEEEHNALYDNLQKAFSDGSNAPYSPYRDWRTLSGVDLTIGGEGMKKFYDEMLPKRLMKLAKQHDPDAKFSVSTVKHPKEYSDIVALNNMSDTTTDLPTLEITPKMRESILKKGFAAYADGGEVEGYAGGGDVEGYQDPATQHISDWNWRSVGDVQDSLGGMKEIPSHVEKFGDFMDTIAQRAGGSGLTPRDLIKAYTITRSSIQRRAADVDKLRASGLDLPEEMTGKIRPEGAFGEWLHTPAGQAYLDAAEKGKVHQTAIQNAIQVMAPFGRHQTDIPDALTWAALNLPGKEKQVSELVHAGHLMASTPEEWRAFTQHIRGVGPSKSGFLASLMGRGDQPTLDARQIILHTGRPTKEASKYIAKKGGAGGVEAVDRLAARQSAMDLSLPDRLKPYYQHLTHHAVWDKAGDEETTHEDVVRAMHHAAKGGAQNGDDESILSHPVAKIFQTIGMAGLNDPSVDPAKFKEYLKRAQYALARKITTKGSDVLASYPGAANVKMSKFGKPLSEMESTTVQKGFMLPRKEADIEEMQRRGSRIFPFLGDLSPADQILLKTGQTSLVDPSEQQGGAGFMRSEFAQGRDPAAYGNRIGAAKTLAKKIAAQTPEGTPAIGTHVAMGLGSVDSSHHAYEPILRMIPNSPIAQKHIDDFDDMMREALPATKKYPMAWPGIMNTKEAEQFFAGRPGTHASFFAKKIDSSRWQKAGFPDIGEVRFSASTPELLGAPRLSTGSAFSQVEPSGRIVTNPDLKHKTYPALIPSEGEGYMGGSSTPIPAKLMFSDFFKTMKTKDKSGKAINYDSPTGQTLFQQSLMTKVPFQDATQEWLDNIMEDRRQKQEQGFKKGGKVRSALMIAKGMKKR